MSELIVTWILWSVVSFTSPVYETFQVVDEEETNEACTVVAKGVAFQVQKEIEEKNITNVNVMLSCIPVLEIKNPENLNGSGLIKPKPRSKREPIG